MTRTHFLWILWIVITLGLGGWFLSALFLGGDRTDLLPGQTAGVHHQLEIACETCHTSAVFADQSTIRKDINKTCVTCHKDELNVSDDSHPKKKFTNPRMANYWEKVDARWCTTCHQEHEPEITLAGMLTLPGDYCVACHSEGEQNIFVNRPSHVGLGFDTCQSAGCHNFHDNRALYEDFLVKHADQPWLMDPAVHPLQAMARARPRAAEAEIQSWLAGIDAPAALEASDAVADMAADWAHSAHAVAEVTCGGCHAPKQETPQDIAANWIDAPKEEVCASCHRGQARTFALGRHGMLRHPDIARPRKARTGLRALGVKDPSDRLIALVERYLAEPELPAVLSTDAARVSLQPEAHGRDLTCNTCHDPHAQDLQYAAVEACLTCHGDDHSQAYKASPHFALWQAEQAGDLPPGAGVSCATCHLEKSERKGIVTTNHNQNDILRPNEKMIRPVCMSCHGLGFAIDALADPALIENNFSGQPYRHVESIDWAVKRVASPETSDNK